MAGRRRRYPREIAQRLSKGKKQKRIYVGRNLFRIEGVKGIYAKVKIKGTTYNPPLGTEDPEEARERFEQWVVNKRKSLKQVCAAEGTPASYVEAYLASRNDEVALGRLKPLTIANLRKTYHRLGLHWRGFTTISLEKFFRPKTIEGVGTFLLTKARSRLRPKQPLSPGSYNSLVSAISLLLGYFKDQGKLAEELYLQLRNKIEYAKVPARQIQMLTMEQLKQMRAYLYQVRQGKSYGETGVKFDVYMLSSQRKATVNAMKVEHFDFVKGEVLLTKLKGRAGQPTEAVRPMPPELAEIVQRYIKARGLKEGDSLWRTKNNNNAFRTAARRVGLDRWYAHACRKWFGTTALKRTRDPLAVSDMMCHRDGGKILLNAYRQLCSEHLQSTANSLKLYPGAIPGKSLEAAAAQAKAVITKILVSNTEPAARALDAILWIESKLDSRDYQALTQLPRLGQEQPAIYTQTPSHTVEKPTPMLVKNNLKHLITQKGAYHSDIAVATGIPRSTIARACKFGDLQACFVPAICGYFGIAPQQLLTSDLTRPADTSETSSRHDAPSQLETESQPPPVKCEKTFDDLIVQHDPAAVAETIAQNLAGMMFERNLTANGLALKAGIAAPQCYKILKKEVVPKQDTLLKLAKALDVTEVQILEPRRENVVPNPSLVKANLNAIIAHHGIASSTYFLRVCRMDSKIMHEVLATGDISALQAHRIVRTEGEKFSVRRLVMEDITAMYPPAPVLDPLVISRNLKSIGWERGLYPAEIARMAGISPMSAVAYAQARSRRIDRNLLTEVARALGISLAELADPARPEIAVTPFFKTNLQHLIDSSGMAPTPLGEACGIELKVLRTLLDGTDPNPHQVAKLVRYFRLSPRELLMTDLSASHSAAGEPPTQNLDRPTTQESKKNASAELGVKDANSQNEFVARFNGAATHEGLGLSTGVTSSTIENTCCKVEKQFGAEPLGDASAREGDQWEV
jgi:transcriptional regulator with XRE-family HTH domain/integrase